MNVQKLAKLELAKMNESYYGSEKQIAKEIAIMKASKIEMLYNETIEEWLYKVSTIENDDKVFQQYLEYNDNDEEVRDLYLETLSPLEYNNINK